MQVQILRNELPIPTDGSFTGSGQDCQAPEGTVVYVLQAINADGNGEYMQAIVEVCLRRLPPIGMQGGGRPISGKFLTCWVGVQTGGARHYN